LRRPDAASGGTALLTDPTKQPAPVAATVGRAAPKKVSGLAS